MISFSLIDTCQLTHASITHIHRSAFYPWPRITQVWRMGRKKSDRRTFTDIQTEKITTAYAQRLHAKHRAVKSVTYTLRAYSACIRRACNALLLLHDCLHYHSNPIRVVLSYMIRLRTRAGILRFLGFQKF